MRAEFQLHDLNSGQASSAGLKPLIIYTISVWRVFLRTLIRIVDPTFSNQSNSYSHLAFQWSSSLQEEARIALDQALTRSYCHKVLLLQA